MADEPRHRLRRRCPIQVEPLEGRTLLSAAKTTTPPQLAQLVISPTSESVNQQQGSFTVTLYLKKELTPRVAATLDAPLTVDFSASTNAPYSATPETASPVFAPVHESVTFPAGASAETVTVPIISSATTTVPTAIYLSVGLPSGSTVPLSLPGFVSLYSSSEAYPPAITRIQLVTQGKLASAVVLSFSKPMAWATVEDIGNYRIVSRPSQTSHKGFLFWGGSTTTEIQSFPIAAANYDPSTSAVTLTLKRPTRASSLYEVSSAYPLQGHELTDTEGQTIGSSSTYGYMMVDGFTNLIHPIPGFTPYTLGPLKTTVKTDSPISNLDPMKGFA
jgi:hypothetical protein